MHKQINKEQHETKMHKQTNEQNNTQKRGESIKLQLFILSRSIKRVP